MESIEMSLNTLAFVNISNEIDNHLNVLYCNYESLQSYALLIGSKGDSYQKNNMFINTLSLCIKELVKIYEIIIYTGEHQFIHKNEKVECLFKIKPKVKDTNLFVDKLFALFFDIRQQNKNYYKNSPQLTKERNNNEINKIKNTIDDLLLK